MKANEDNIRALDAIAGVTQRVPIDGQPSLYLQVTGSPGDPVKSWLFRYRLANGKQVNHTIGRWPEFSWTAVRKLMIGLRAEAAKGVKLESPRVARAKAVAPAPAPVVTNTTPTVREVAEKFYEGHVLVKNQPSTQKFQRWALDKYVLPQLGDLKITELTPQAISTFLDGLGSTPVTANRVKALLSKMFNWSGRRFVAMSGVANPATGHERNDEIPRERRMSQAEIFKLGVAYRKSPDPLKAAAIFLLLTGCRVGAVLHLQDADKLPDEGLLLFDAKTPGLKGCRKVYYARTAASLLEKFPPVVLRRSLWRSWTKFRNEAGLGPKPVADGVKPKTEDLAVSLHDLRRTWASIGVDLGHDGGVVDAAQGHSIGKIRGTYQKRSNPVLAKVAEEIGEHIASLLGIGVPKPKIVAAKPATEPMGEQLQVGRKAVRMLQDATLPSDPNPKPKGGSKTPKARGQS